MKRLIPASILLIFVATIYLISLNYINNSCKEADKLLKSSVTDFQTSGTAYENTKKLNDFWDEKEKFLSFFVNHNHIDEIELAISALCVYSKDKNNILYLEYADKVKVLLHQILEETKVSTHSIF